MLDLGPYFGRDDVTDDVIIESLECLGKFRKCISVTLPKGFGQIFSCFAVRTNYVHLTTKYTPPSTDEGLTITHEIVIKNDNASFLKP